MKSPFVVVLLIASLTGSQAQPLPKGVKRVDLLNYTDCIQLSNEHTIVVLGQQVGGRVLKYAWKGRDALYLSEDEAKWGTDEAPRRPQVSAGRFDIGPEYLIPQRDELWSGTWEVKITGRRSARLISQESPQAGVQIIRDFRLAKTSSHLICKQIIKNISSQTKRWSHWSRTFAKHGGIAVVPLTRELSHLPNGYVMYEGRGLVNFLPEDPNIRIRGEFLEILAPPAQPKLGMDSYAGWFAYQMPNDCLFVKRYKTYPNRVYNDLAGITISIWYPSEDRTPACELEPIGPRNEIAPGGSASFTEHWWLIENHFPEKGELLDLDALAIKVNRTTK